MLEVKTLKGLSVDDDDLFALCSGGALCQPQATTLNVVDEVSELQGSSFRLLG